MRRLYPLSTGIVTVSILLAPVIGVQVRADAGGSPPERPVFLEMQYANEQGPEPVLADLWRQEKRGPLTFAQQMDMGVALILQSRPEQAAGVFKAVAASVSDDKQKAAAFVYAAQSLALAKDWRGAGDLANRAGQLAPQSKSIAALRFTFWKMAGDALEQQAATDRLQQLDVNYDGKAVFEPGTVIIVSLTMIAAASVISWIVVTKPNAEDLHKVLHETLSMVVEIGLPVLIGAAG